MEPQAVLNIFRKTGALLEGHFQLTSGLHSNQYFQCAKVLQYPEHCEQLCGELARQAAPLAIDVVVAPALGGIVVAQEVGRQLRKRTMFTERKEGTMQLRRGFAFAPGERVLVCEDVVTTGGSVMEVIEIVKQQGGEVAAVAFLVDRSGGAVRFPAPHQFSVLQLSVVAHQPAACPLCAAGIPIAKPGSRGNDGNAR